MWHSKRQINNPQATLNLFTPWTENYVINLAVFYLTFSSKGQLQSLYLAVSFIHLTILDRYHYIGATLGVNKIYSFIPSHHECLVPWIFTHCTTRGKINNDYLELAVRLEVTERTFCHVLSLCTVLYFALRLVLLMTV